MSPPRHARAVPVRRSLPERRAPAFEALEPRCLMSVDLAPGAALGQAAPAAVELVVIDGGVPDLQQLISELTGDATRQVEVVVIAPDSDGFAQVADLLSRRNDIAALHIISSAREGALHLGTSTLDPDHPEMRAAALSQWHRAFQAEGNPADPAYGASGDDDESALIETRGAALTRLHDGFYIQGHLLQDRRGLLGSHVRGQETLGPVPQFLTPAASPIPDDLLPTGFPTPVADFAFAAGAEFPAPRRPAGTEGSTLTVWLDPGPDAEATGQLTTMDPARIERRALHFVPRGDSAVIRPDPVTTSAADADVRGAALTEWRNAFGAGVGTVSEMLWPGTPVSGFSETLAPPAVPVAPPDTRPLELVVIDGAVDDAEQLVAGLNLDASRRFEVVMLDAGRDGVEQITELLASRSDVSALHIVSHGAQGILQLGTTLLDTDSLSSRAAALTQWHRAFTAGADILLYGCDLAGNLDGVRFMTTLGALAGADVAASDDPTGAASRGGDWTLERQFGHVQTAVAFGDAAGAPVYDHVLTLAAQESFTGSVTVPLAGSGTGTGWTGAWSAPAGGFQVNGTPTLADPANQLPTSGAVVVGNLGASLLDAEATRTLTTPLGVNGTSTWVSFLLRPDQIASGSNCMGVVVGATTSLFAGYNDGKFVLEEPGGAGRVFASGITPTAGQTYFLALEINSVAGNDTARLYVNPTPGKLNPDSTAARIVTRGDVDLGAIGAITLSTGRSGTGVTNASAIDELRIGQSFTDVAPSATPLNEAPSGANATRTFSEDTAYTFSTADFGFSDLNDTPANALLGVKITTAPAAGSLTLSGVAVTAGQIVSA
ncbi:MAG: DUF4347 domain-containing protein, partial [Betaproteobacteria bacterium]